MTGQLSRPLFLDWTPAPATLLCLLTVLLPCVGLIFVLLSRSGTDTLPSTVYVAIRLLLANLCINTAANVANTHSGILYECGKSPVTLSTT